ncbi:amidase signature enzyme [Gloeophyllum trabeum ATCC 11539]|uniref:amidase n=1 Tax=Gloeophyllum trabeum (strain ATCC 11539 / FP-39264 / Madison 617) TaxID=670483 RepID=S7RLH9_GLOTA|nr:amidase signature enzyme [Gloeophyllum trabeum ATCC 11539]EPQ53514.1 amidase signature enzyme [Gloeophyllum trabeum ATCC 11539]
MLLSYILYRRARATKQKEQQEQINSLPLKYHAPLTSIDTTILGRPVAEIVVDVQAGQLSPSDVLVAYGKKALKAQAANKCLTEVMIDKAELWAEGCNRQGPLAGMPVSLKDMFYVAGYDSCIGYASWVGRRAQADSPLVTLLRRAGAVPYVKTNIPITLMSFEAGNDLFGQTENPHKKGYSAGGSSGGEASLLAYGGSRIGIGTDIAGSVRVPSHYSGTYTVKCSPTRFIGHNTAESFSGQEGVRAVASPMARTLEDLEYFWKAIMSMKPWEYDHNVVELPWRAFDLSEKKLKFGVMLSDGVVTPSPACKRALETVVKTLQNNGYQVVPINPPRPYEGYEIGAQLVGDSCAMSFEHIMTGESNDPGMAQARTMWDLPRWVKRLYGFYLRYVRGDDLYAHVVENWHPKTAQEHFATVARREAYRAKWFDFWQETGLDFILTVPNAMPAVPHGGMRDAFTNCIYTFLWNVLEYTAGVLPVTHVDRDLDGLKPGFKAGNMIEKGAYKHYNADKMHGLPVGVEIVGRRLEEEQVLEGMKLIERLLRDEGKAYTLLHT